MTFPSMKCIMNPSNNKHIQGKRESCAHYIIIWLAADYFPRCYRNDPKLNECLVNATRLVKPYLARGVPELRIPALEPFTLPQVAFEQGTQAVNFKATLYNLSVTGLTSYEFSKFEWVWTDRVSHCWEKLKINLMPKCLERYLKFF